MARSAERVLLACALAAALIFIFVGMGRPIWLDEALSVLIARRNFPGIIDSLSRTNNQPAYYFLLSAWIRLFGESEIALRALSAIFYLAGCWAVFLLGAQISGSRFRGGYSTLFYGFSPLAIRHAQNVRMYALLGLLSALSTLAFLRTFRERGRDWRKWAFLVGVDAFGCLTHAWFAFVLGAQLVVLLVFNRRDVPRFIAAVFAAALPFVIFWGPIFVGQLRNGAGDWMLPFRPELLVSTPLEYYSPALAMVLYGLAVVGWVHAIGGKRPALPGGIKWLGVMLCATVAAPLLISAAKPIYWPGRYTIIGLPAVAAILGTLLPSLTPRLLLAPVCLALLIFQAGNHISGRATNPESDLPAGQSDRDTAEFLLAHASAGDAVVFTSLTRAAADYYFRRAGADRRFVEISFPAEVATDQGWARTRLTPDWRRQLESEAAGVARRLDRLAAEGSKVWVYYGHSLAVSDILKQNLDSTLKLVKVYPLRGPYHTQVLEYERGGA